MNNRVTAKAKAITTAAKEWGLPQVQAETKFNAQPQKWRKRQVNKALKSMGK